MAALADANDLAYDDLANASPQEGSSEAGWRTFQGGNVSPPRTYEYSRQLAGAEILLDHPEIAGAVVFGWG